MQSHEVKLLPALGRRTFGAYSIGAGSIGLEGEEEYGSLVVRALS